MFLSITRGTEVGVLLDRCERERACESTITFEKIMTGREWRDQWAFRSPIIVPAATAKVEYAHMLCRLTA